MTHNLRPCDVECLSADLCSEEEACDGEGSQEKGGAQAGRLSQKLFNGSISPSEIKDLRRILQAEFVDADGVTQSGAQAWQNLKGTWLMTQFDDAVTGTVNPLGASNKFLTKFFETSLISKNSLFIITSYLKSGFVNFKFLKSVKYSVFFVFKLLPL